MAPLLPEGVVDLAVPVRPEVVADLGRLALPSQRAVLVALSLLEVVVDLGRLAHRAQLAVPALREVVAELAVEQPLHRWYSAAMVGNLPSAGLRRYSPVPRSGRKAKRRP